MSTTALEFSREDYSPDSRTRDNLNHKHDLRRGWFLLCKNDPAH
jgi:hypothetical protein